LFNIATNSNELMFDPQMKSSGSNLTSLGCIVAQRRPAL
jgi:hypothetical protein